MSVIIKATAKDPDTMLEILNELTHVVLKLPCFDPPFQTKEIQRKPDNIPGHYSVFVSTRKFRPHKNPNNE